MEGRWDILFLIVLAFLSLQCKEGFCQDGQDDFLKGIKAVSLLVDDIPKEVENSCIAKEQVVKDIESELLESGIVIAPRTSTTVENAYVPFLYVNLNVLVSQEQCIYRIGIEIQDEISLKRNNLEGIATTWNYAVIGIAPTFEYTTIRDNLRDIAGRFIRSYRAVNPGKSSSGSGDRGRIAGR